MARRSSGCGSVFPGLDLVLLESGGDNLASTFSLDLVDYWLFVIDVADGDDIPRKRGPGIVNCDLLVINKIDLAPYVGADVAGMQRDSLGVRHGKPVLLTNCRSGEGIDAVIDRIAHDVLLVHLIMLCRRIRITGPPNGCVGFARRDACRSG